MQLSLFIFAKNLIKVHKKEHCNRYRHWWTKLPSTFHHSH